MRILTFLATPLLFTSGIGGASLNVLFGLLFAFMSPVLLVSQQPGGATAIQRDTQAVALLAKVIQNSGGLSLQPVHDLRATGTIDYFQAAPATAASITVSARGMDQLRIDESTPESSSSSGNNDGSTWRQSAGRPGKIYPRQDNVHPVSFILPLLPLAEALRDSTIAVTDLGVTIYDGQQQHGIRVQRTYVAKSLTGHVLSDWSRQDFFIDLDTLHVVRLRYQLHPASLNYRVVQQDILFDDFRAIDGITVAHKITSMDINNRRFIILFSGFQFNVGTSAVDFEQPD